VRSSAAAERAAPGSGVRRVGIVGCGAVTRTNYAKSLPQVAGVRVAFVHDLNKEAAVLAAEQFGAAAVSLDALCGQVDTVIVATPPGTHYEIVKTCLERGRNVVCEKPFVGRVQEARELVELAAARGVSLHVGHLRRTFASVRLARELIMSGTLGAVRRLLIAEGGRFSWDVQSGYVSSDPLGGVLFDTGSHSLDVALFVTGLDTADLAVTVLNVRRDRPEPAHDLEAELQLREPEDEVSVRLLLSRYRALANRVRIELEHGTVDVPVGPRECIRVRGERASAVLRTAPASTDYNEYFLAQWRAVFGGLGANAFDARNFIGLIAILEAVGATT
jgi:predicted dehydrogenase